MEYSPINSSPTFRDGYDAYNADKALTDNPYDVGTFLFRVWQDGWYQAGQDDAQKEAR